MTRLLTVSDKMLKATGMAHDEASAAAGFKTFCQHWRDEHEGEPEPDFLHLRQEIWDDEIGPVVALGDSVDGSGPTQRPAISLCLTTAPSDSTSAERVNAAPARLTETRASMPASLQDIEQSRAAAQHRQAMVQTTAQMLGLHLPERGVTFAQVERVASALGCKAALLPGGDVRLESRFGQGVYVSLDAAANALRLRAFHPGALGDG